MLSWDLGENLLKEPFTEVKIGLKRNVKASRNQPQLKATMTAPKGSGKEMAWQMLEPSERSWPTGRDEASSRTFY